MTKVMDVLEEYCRLRAFTYLRLDGSTSAEVRTESLIKYNAPDSPYFIFMLSTKAGGLGLNLQSADTVILFGASHGTHARCASQHSVRAETVAHALLCRSCSFFFFLQIRIGILKM